MVSCGKEHYRCSVCSEGDDGEYREGQMELHCIFVDLEKAYDGVLGQKLWY